MSTQLFNTNEEDKFLESLEKELKKRFSENEKIAIKLHMGEPGSKTRLSMAFVKKIIDVLLKIKTKPFLFDSPVRYNSVRNTSEGYLESAKKEGWTEEFLKCPIIISNKSKPFKGKYTTYNVCKDLIEADGVLVLSHVTGHVCVGMGAAIKNLGMGALSKETKDLIHNGGKPVYIGNCTMCEDCSKNCYFDNIRYENNQPYFDKNFCCGCSKCILACKFNALKPKLEIIDNLIADGAVTAKNNFKKVYYINVMKNITELCDCPSDGNSGKLLTEDLGFVIGDNMSEVDKTSYEIIKEKAGKDIFLKTHKKSPPLHIEAAEKIEAGNLK